MLSNIQDKSLLSGAQAGIITSRSLWETKGIIQDTSKPALESATLVQGSREGQRTGPGLAGVAGDKRAVPGAALHLCSCQQGGKILSIGRADQQFMARHTLLCFAASSPHCW